MRLIKETSLWNQLNPLRKWGHHLRHWVFVPVREQQLQLPPPWGFSWGLFGSTSCTPRRTGGLSTGAPLHLLLSSCRKLLSCSAPRRVEALGFVRLESCSPLLVWCCLNQEGMEFQVIGRDWPCSSVRFDRCCQNQPGVTWGVLCPSGHRTRGKCSLAQVGMANGPGGLLAPAQCKGTVSWPPCKHSTSERFGWLCQEEVAQSDVFTLDWTYPLAVLFSSGWAWNVCLSCSLSLCIQLLNWLISLLYSWWLQREFALN